MTSTMMSCVTPGAVDGRPGLVMVEVSANGGADFTSDGKMYMYEMGATVQGLQPSWGWSGAVGQVVTVVGHHFEQSPELSCRFGLEGRTPGLYMTSSAVACSAPEHGPGSVTVTVTNGVERQDRMQDAGVRYEYKTDGVAWLAEPSLGPLSGGTRVTVTGAVLEHGADGVDCIFGAERVAAETVGAQGLVCVSPRMQVPGRLEMRLVHATSKNRIGGSAQFEYYATPRVTGVLPSRGSSTGGTAVSVIGSGFRDDAGLRCRFGGAETGSVSVGGGARWMTSTVVMCVAPGATAGEAAQVAVEVSGNGGADFTKDGIEFLYESAATVEALMPSWGVSGRAGQVVTVSGRHFARSSDLSCRFGLEGSIRGQYASSTVVKCTVPERGGGTVTVTVSDALGVVDRS